MRLAAVVIYIILFICLLNYGIDFFFQLKDRYSRFHIGRWEKAVWEKAVENKAVKWLKVTPVVKITDNTRYILLDFVTGKYRSHTIQSWQKASLILGLLESGNKEAVRNAQKAAAVLLNENGSWKKKPSRVDCGMLSYAVMQASEDPESVKTAMEESLSVIRSSINEEGLISYTGQRENPDMYVDTLGLCCPFLAKYAKAYGRPEYEETAFKQLLAFHDNGLLVKTEIPNHAYSAKYKMPLGVYGWGRGIGWYVIGLVESYENMQNEKYRRILKTWIRDAAEDYKKFQRKDGGFGSIIQSLKTYDSSATAALAWFYAKCGSLFSCEEYYSIADRCLGKLLKCTRITGAIDWCQGDTKGIGIFSQTYDVMPFAQGMAVRAVHTLNKRPHNSLEAKS